MSEYLAEAERWRRVKERAGDLRQVAWKAMVDAASLRFEIDGGTIIQHLEDIVAAYCESSCACKGTRRVPWPEAGMMQDCPACVVPELDPSLDEVEWPQPGDLTVVRGHEKYGLLEFLRWNDYGHAVLKRTGFPGAAGPDTWTVDRRLLLRPDRF